MALYWPFAMALQIDQTVHGSGATVYKLSGRLTAGLEATALEVAIEKSHAAGVVRIVVDMKEIYYVDSSGLGALISALTKLKKSSGALRLACVDERVVKIMKLTRLDTIFPMDESVHEACLRIGGV
jgi:anti-sigma B factor antagonist